MTQITLNNGKPVKIDGITHHAAMVGDSVVISDHRLIGDPPTEGGKITIDGQAWCVKRVSRANRFITLDLEKATNDGR